MANFTEVIKIAVETQDWELLCGLYTTITGEPLSPPEKEETDPLKMDFDVASLTGQLSPPQIIPEEKSLEEREEELDNYRKPLYNLGETVMFQSPSGKKPNPCEVIEVMITDFGEFMGLYRIKMKQNGRKYNITEEEIWLKKKAVPEPELEDEPEPTGDASFITSSKRDDTEMWQSQNSDGLTQMRKEPVGSPKQKRYFGTAARPFEDNLTEGLVDGEGNSLLQTEEVKKKLSLMPRANRSESEDHNDTGKKITVECSLCERQVTIAPSLAVGYKKDRPGTKIAEKHNTFKCDTCNSHKGRTQLLREDSLVRHRN